ncbi:MAG: nucleotide-binding protein [Methanoregula sp.]|jgi:replication factor A1
MDFSEAADRISRKFSKSGHEIDQKKIEGKLRRLIDEFGVQPAEAERSVTNELAKEFNIPMGGPGSSGGKGSGTESKKIAEVLPEEWVTIEGKVVALSAPASPSIAQSGIIADDSGGIRFVAWAKSNAPKMAEGSWYRIESAVVDEFKGVANIKIHSGTTVTELGTDGALIPTAAPIKDLHPGIGSVRAKVVQEWDATHERMLQSGLLGDETGTIKFVIWKEPGKEQLVPGSVYNIFYAQVDEFNGRLSLNLNSATIMQEDGDIAVNGGEVTVRGSIVHIAPGSGIIKRCPVEGCNRALSRQNYCPVHEIQPKFIYDLRIKGWLDDGEKTHSILLQRDVVESLTGISLADAQEIAENNPLGMDEVFLRMRDAILGRYVTCSGREIDNRLLVNKCERLVFDSSEHTSLLNRAGGAS